MSESIILAVEWARIAVKYSAVSRVAFVGLMYLRTDQKYLFILHHNSTLTSISSFPFDTYHFNSKELPTTDTELKAIAADDIHGCKKNPNELNIPAAMGMPSRL